MEEDEQRTRGKNETKGNLMLKGKVIKLKLGIENEY